jgi:ATP dependent DNA ligase C terminal region
MPEVGLQFCLPKLFKPCSAPPQRRLVGGGDRPLSGCQAHGRTAGYPFGANEFRDREIVVFLEHWALTFAWQPIYPALMTTIVGSPKSGSLLTGNYVWSKTHRASSSITTTWSFDADGNTSAVAVCCSSASRVSVSSRAFSIAMTACAAKFMPLDQAAPRSNRFGSPLVLSRVHWVRPELVVEVKYLTWTDDNLLRQVVYEGLREDKVPREVRQPIP